MPFIKCQNCKDGKHEDCTYHTQDRNLPVSCWCDCEVPFPKVKTEKKQLLSNYIH